MIDHTGVAVSHFDQSTQFHARALAPIGYALRMEFSAAQTGGEVAGFDIAFRVAKRELVDAFHAIAASGRDNGAPGLRPHYHLHYYGAFVRDPDGHNVEAVCHEPQ